ncbi:MAG TPA: hypothetical protein DDY13_11875 [Cytophagales bacterium]|jgi:hypothetical protein|nr:hypothetical protein [Cytophagales bacterium]
MPKKNKKKSGQPTLTPRSYLQQKRARRLPIKTCWITKNWKGAGKANVAVVREHKGEHFTIGFYLVDLYCTGVKDTWYLFNISKFEYEDIVRQFNDTYEGHEIEECSYELAHNVIFAGLEYAEELGIEPANDFHLTKFILEEDDESIPLIEIEVGFEGKPYLVSLLDDPNTGYYLKILRENVGEGNFLFTESPLNYFGPEFDNEEDVENFLAVEDDDFEGHEDFYDNEFYEWSPKEWVEFLKDSYRFEEEWSPALQNFILYSCLYQSPVDMNLKNKDELDYIVDGSAINEDAKINESLNQADYEKAVQWLLDIQEFIDDRKEIRKLIKGLQKEIKENPHNYILRNYLATCYQSIDEKRKWLEVAKETYELFPNYVVGILNLALVHLYNDDPKAMLDLLGMDIKISKTFPFRSEFYPSEIIQFCEIWQIYYLQANNLQLSTFFNQARNQLAMSYEIMFDNNQFLQSSLDDLVYVEIVDFIESLKDKPGEQKKMAKKLSDNLEMFNGD